MLVVGREVGAEGAAEVGVAVVVALDVEALVPAPALGHAEGEEVGEDGVAVVSERSGNVWVATDVVVEVIHCCVVFLARSRELELLGDSRGVRHAQGLEFGVGAEVVVVVAGVVYEGMLDDDAGNAEGSGLADDAVVVLRGAAVGVGVIDVAGLVVARLDTAVVEPECGELIEDLLRKVNADGVGLQIVAMAIGHVDLRSVCGAGARGVEVNAHEDARTGVRGALGALLERGVLVLTAGHDDRCAVLVDELVTAVSGDLPGEVCLTDAVHADGPRVIAAVTGVEGDYEAGGARAGTGARNLLGRGDCHGHALGLDEVSVLVDRVGGHGVMALLPLEGERGDAVGDGEGAHLGVTEVDDVQPGIRDDAHAADLIRAHRELRRVKGEEGRHGIRGGEVVARNVLAGVVLNGERRRRNGRADLLVERYDDVLRLAGLNLCHVEIEKGEDVG